MLKCSVLLVVLFLVSCVNAEEAKMSLADFKVILPATEDFKKLWTEKDGVITGGDGENKIKKNTFLCTEKEYENFELTCSFKLSGDHKTGLINSGIQYRSIIKDGHIIGYQADIGKGYWGDIYDEHRRGLLIKGKTAELFKNFTEDGWNIYKIVCIGNKHETFINGFKVAEYEEKKSDIPGKGVIAFQVHSGGKAKLELKDIVIKELTEIK